jgi:bifunctional ADP-heptose synthase (sugar kinase/adenylyltransferase)
MCCQEFPLIHGEHSPVTTGARSVPGFLLLAPIAEPIVRYLRGAPAPVDECKNRSCSLGSLVYMVILAL